MKLCKDFLIVILSTIVFACEALKNFFINVFGAKIKKLPESIRYSVSSLRKGDSIRLTFLSYNTIVLIANKYPHLKIEMFKKPICLQHHRTIVFSQNPQVPLSQREKLSVFISSRVDKKNSPWYILLDSSRNSPKYTAIITNPIVKYRRKKVSLSVPKYS